MEEFTPQAPFGGADLQIGLYNQFTLLYLDDDAGNRSVFEALMMRDYKVILSETPAEALDHLRTGKVDLLLTDHRMPAELGTEFLERIRPEFPALPTMIVTAYADVDIVVHALNDLGVRRYILKPWNKTELRAAVADVCRGLTLQRENARLLAEVKASNEALKDALLETQAQNQQLASFSLQLAGKGESLAQVRGQLNDLHKVLATAQAQARELAAQLGASERLDAQWEEFLRMFDRTQADFLRRLMQAQPSLTLAERRLAVLMRMNMGTKEIANITNISPESVSVARHRLRRKLGLQEGQALEAFIAQI